LVGDLFAVETIRLPIVFNRNNRLATDGTTARSVNPLSQLGIRREV
jgi:hypothetical protein